MMDERFTIHAQSILKHAREKATQFGSKFVDPEYLLLALVEEEKCLGTTVLYYLGLDPRSLRFEAIQSIESQKHPYSPSKVQYSMETQRIIDLAIKESEGLCDKCIGSEHLLLGIIREGDSLAAQILQKHQINLVKARGEILRQKHELSDPEGPLGKVLHRLQDFKEKNDQLNLPQMLTDIGFVREDDILNVLGENLGMQVFHLSNEPIPLEVVHLLPLEICTKYQVIPIKLEETTATIALADPFDMQVIDTIRFYLSEKEIQVLFVIAPKKEINAAIARYYPDQESGEELGSAFN